MRVLVCGGREFGFTRSTDPRLKEIANDQFMFIFDKLDQFLEQHDVEILIAGGANGADDLAESWAKLNNIKTEIYPADWEKYGKRAGYVRNKEMLESGKPDIILAFPGGQGTKNMIQLGLDAGVPVTKFTYELRERDLDA